MILVTGSTGLLGNTIVRQLVRQGREVRVFCRPSSDLTTLADVEVEVVSGQLTNQSDVRLAIDGCSGVINCAAMIHLGKSKLKESREINVIATRILAEQCHSSSARMVHVSTVNVLDAAAKPDEPLDETDKRGVAMPEGSYVISKREAEEALRDIASRKALNLVVVRPGFMLGPNDWKPSSGRMFIEVVRSPLVTAPPGSCSVCDARDVATGVINALDVGRRGEDYILAGENMSYSRLWRQMIRVAGRSKLVWRLPPRVHRIGPLIDGFNKVFRREEGDVNSISFTMGCLHHCYSSAKAERELSYSTRPVAETLADAWTWLVKHHDSPTNPSRQS